MTPDPCEHCGLTPKSNWLTDCRYVLTLPVSEREMWRQSGADAPCAVDDYDMAEAEGRMATLKHIGMTFAVLGSAMLLAAWLTL